MIRLFIGGPAAVERAADAAAPEFAFPCFARILQGSARFRANCRHKRFFISPLYQGVAKEANFAPPNFSKTISGHIVEY
ncbi:MAG: hypothetical protein ACLQE9_04660, partial [Roseiarcus sp.]